MRNSILIVGSFSKGALEHQYVRVLSEQGFDVSTYDIQKKVNLVREKSVFSKALFKINQSLFYENANIELFDLVVSIKPKYILVFKGMEIFPETLMKIKKTGSFLVNYNPDHPLQFFSEGAGNSNVLKSISIFDLYISYSTKIVSELNDKYSNAACIPFGYDETIKIPNSPINEIVFIGAYDKTREAELSNIESDKLSIYGPVNWSKKLSRNEHLLSKYKGRPLYDIDYYSTIGNAIASINILRKQNIIEGSHNMRTFETAGVGGLLISNRTKEHLTFFEEGVEAYYFDTIDQLNDILNNKMKDLDKIKKMKNAAISRCIVSKYSYNDRVKEFINLI